jgi:hypothetical protein
LYVAVADGLVRMAAAGECPECHAVVRDADAHKRWHRSIDRSINEASPDFKGY